MLTEEERHTYEVIFKQFDEDGSGNIDIQELKRALASCGIECTEAEAVSMMSSVDDSGDLEIGFDEFIALIENFKSDLVYASSSSSSESDLDFVEEAPHGHVEWSSANDVNNDTPLDLEMLHERRVASVRLWNEKEMPNKLMSLRSIREKLQDSLCSGSGETETKKVAAIAIDALSKIKCPFVPSGSFFKEVKREHARLEPQPRHVVAFIDEVVECVLGRMVANENFTLGFDADDLYSLDDGDEEAQKRQQEMLKLVEAENNNMSDSSSEGEADEAVKCADPHKQKRQMKLDAALDTLSGFTFDVEIDTDRVVGSAAFRAKVKQFPYYMFPIESVVVRLDALDELHDTYEKAIVNKEALLKPACSLGNKCSQLGILEHQLACTHPCYSDVVPCPHRYRPMHMRCFHHYEDDNPSVESALKEIQSRLFTLDLANLEMGDTGCECISHVLERDVAVRHKNNRVKYLRIGGNHISPSGASVLLQQCCFLTTLDLSNNGLGYKGSILGGSNIGPAIQLLLSRSESLVSLNLSRNRLSDRDGRYIAEALKTNTILSHLNLEKNELGVLFGPDMAAALQENRDLKTLLLGWNRLESSGTSSLLSEMRTSSTIETVDLSWTGVTDEGAKMLAEMISGSQLLKSVVLSHNAITGEGLKLMSKPVAASKSITHFDISHNNIGGKAARAFLVDMHDNWTVKVLDLRSIKAGAEIQPDMKSYIKHRGSKGQPLTVHFGDSTTNM